MATQEEIHRVVTHLQTMPQPPALMKMSESAFGVGAVLRLLRESRAGQATAGQIAEWMNVSTARVAVLLKKMEAKGLLTRQRDPGDGRVTVVCLSEQGKQLACRMRRSAEAMIGEVIDKVGMEALEQFLCVARQLAEIVPQPCLECEEGEEQAEC